MPVQYDDKIVRIEQTSSAEGTEINTPDGKVTVKGWTNEITREFQTQGYVVLRNFIPKEVIDMTMDSWKTIELNKEWNDMFFVREEDIVFESPETSLRKSQGCHTFPPSVGMHHWLKNALGNVLDFHLVETYAYSRKYDRGAFLKAHSDRPSCEVSATICLKYKTDDNTPWKIWIQRDKNYINDARGKGQEQFFDKMQNIPHRERKGTCVSLEVGDVLLYQGPNAPHWRDTLLGDYSYHMFLHFINHDGNIIDFPDFQQPSSKLDHGRLEGKKGDARPRSAFAYDGRLSRYHPNAEQQPYFHKAMDFWNQWQDGAHEWFDPAQYINHYAELEDVELTDREKKRFIKNNQSVNNELLRFFKTAYCFTDSQRNKSYEDWISENVKDKVVIDLGAGSGILCYFAVKYGAKKVYALERRGELIDRMKEILGDSVEYIHGDLLETELPKCDIYLHEWLTSEFWNEKRFLKNFYQEGDKELEVGHILDLVEYAKKNDFVDKLYPNMVELSDIEGESTTEWVDINIPSHSKYSKKFLEDYYGNLTQNSIYKNKITNKEIIWEGHIRDLTHHKVENYLGWKLSFDNNHVLSNHLPVSHWGLKHDSI
tara:strand:+ start:315 stop:2108 length:1794 start_codon:yes stop_codon:yes gene_type:complete